MSHAQKALSTTPILKIWGKGCPIHVAWAQIAKALATRAVQAGIYFTFAGGTSVNHIIQRWWHATHRLWQVGASFSSCGGCSVTRLMMIHDDIWFLHKLAVDYNTHFKFNQQLLQRTSHGGTVGRCATVNFPRQRLHSSNHPCKETEQRIKSCLRRPVPMWKDQAKEPPTYNQHLCMQALETGWNWLKLADAFHVIIHMETSVPCKVSMAVAGVKHHSHTAEIHWVLLTKNSEFAFCVPSHFLNLPALSGGNPLYLQKAV